ncbi:WD40 repeat-like protein [Copromyces sp. CBS 386.78]|nr:WD40 repeat-like protein [Copromyces sp. CBS 386.78]
MDSRPGDPARVPLTNGSSADATTVASTTTIAQQHAGANNQSNGSLRVAEQRHQPDNLEHPPFKRQRTETVPVTTPTSNNHLQHHGNPQSSPRYGDQDVFVKCLVNQVFPHVDRELANVPRDKYDVEKIGTKVVEIVTGVDFTAAYKLGNGRVSDVFERLLAARIPVEIRSLLMLPQYRFKSYTPVPVPQITRAPPQAPFGYATAPLPPPPPRPGSGSDIPPTFLAANERRYSNSPIPIPVVPGRQEPHRGINPLSGLRNPHAPVVPSHATAGIHRPTILPPPPSQVITIKDDDEEDEDKGAPSAAISVPQPSSPAGSLMILDPPSTSIAQLPSVAQPPSISNLPENSVPEPRRYRGRTSKWRKRVEEEKKSQNRGIVTTSAQNYRSRAHALAWRGHEDSADSQGLSSRLFSEAKRPYLSAEDRANISIGVHKFVRFDESLLTRPTTFHVDFTADEIKALRNLCRRVLGLSSGSRKQDLAKDLRKQLKKYRGEIVKVLDAIRSEKELSRRNRADIERFLHDLVNHKVSRDPSILALKKDKYDLHGELARSSYINSLLLARETSGNRGMALRAPTNFPNEFVKCHEDELELRREWTDCAGDIATIVWVSNDGFICGTTEHSDAHNQQYNKPGNLVLGSCSQGTLRAYADHRIVRPVVEKGENSTDAMRQSQDPWLYSSVVASDYDDVHDRAFTSGFDRKVKIWKVDPSGSSMVSLGEWPHGGNVNFVAASKYDSTTAMVATAADVPTDAVRIYNIHSNYSISTSSYRSFSCSRVEDAEGNTVSTERWAYFPATMQWGRSPTVRHLLLVGYSPRSRTGDDTDIPPDRWETGELCLWDGLTGERWRITSATTQNVFEVLWHPSQACFIAATSPLGLDLDYNTRTQIRVFTPSPISEHGEKSFSPIQTLDCWACDINELTIMPISFGSCYITAGCTDGKTYVWDTAQGDKPIHILRHGEPIEELRGDREHEDVGVKFTAWGRTLDRFYTGSSDGVVKVWNVRSRNPLVRDLLEVPAPVSCGMFSPDKSRLVIGDASGRVFFLSLNEQDEGDHNDRTLFMHMKIPGQKLPKRIRRPQSIIPHPEPEAPTYDAQGRLLDSESGISRGRSYLAKLQLQQLPDRTLGVVQGPNYVETGLFRREAHTDEDPRLPLKASFYGFQQETKRQFSEGVRRYLSPLRPVTEESFLEAKEAHSTNLPLDFNVELLNEETKQALEAEGVDWQLNEGALDLDYEDDNDELVFSSGAGSDVDEF